MGPVLYVLYHIISCVLLHFLIDFCALFFFVVDAPLSLSLSFFPSVCELPVLSGMICFAW